MCIWIRSQTAITYYTLPIRFPMSACKARPNKIPHSYWTVIDFAELVWKYEVKFKSCSTSKSHHELIYLISSNGWMESFTSGSSDREIYLHKRSTTENSRKQSVSLWSEKYNCKRWKVEIYKNKIFERGSLERRKDQSDNGKKLVS